MLSLPRHSVIMQRKTLIENQGRIANTSPSPILPISPSLCLMCTASE
jgi:hypothetical protein